LGSRRRSKITVGDEVRLFGLPSIDAAIFGTTMSTTRRGFLRFGWSLLATAWLFALPAAYGQYVPREMWAGFGERAIPIVSHTATFSEVDADLRIKTARAKFQAGDMREVAEQLRGNAGTFDENDLIRFAKSDDREAALVRAIGAFVDRRDFDAYYQACLVHHWHPDAENPDVRDREASLVQALVLMRAGILGRAYMMSLVDEPPEEKIPLSVSLERELAGKAKFFTEPIAEQRSHPAVVDVNIDVYGAADDEPRSGQLWNILLTTDRAMVLGAFVVASTIDEATSAAVYRLSFHDFDRPPLVLFDYGDQRPVLGEVLEFIDALVPKLGPTEAREDDPATPLRAELEALYWMDQRLAPLASSWARRAGDNRRLEAIVVEPLRRSGHDLWDIVTRAGLWPDAAGRNRLYLTGFANPGVPKGDAYEQSRAPWEHYQMLLVDGAGRFRAAYTLVSRFVASQDPAVASGRVYYLRQQTADGAEEVGSLLPGEPPTFEAFAEVVREQIEGALQAGEKRAAAALGGSSSSFGSAASPGSAASKRGPLPASQIVLMVASMAGGLVLLWGGFYVVAMLLRQVRRMGSLGVLLIGVLLGLVFAAAVLWSSPAGKRLAESYGLRNSAR
jgi:hypothetical protein